MIFERRAYTFKPGMVEAFWQAQEQWNTQDAYGVVLDHNLSYFSTTTGPTDQVIQLYRFQSLDHWKSCYDTYYRTQNPQYFQLVRTQMLQQENGFFAVPPAAMLAASLTGDRPRLPPAVAAAAARGAESLCIAETMIDFFPGGLPPYWAAFASPALAEHPLDAPHRIAVLVSLVGRIHRVIQYRGFASIAEAQEHQAALAADTEWRAFVDGHRGFVAESRTMYLKPSPLPRMRRLFEQASH